MIKKEFHIESITKNEYSWIAFNSVLNEKLKKQLYFYEFTIGHTYLSVRQYKVSDLKILLRLDVSKVSSWCVQMPNGKFPPLTNLI